MKELRHPHPHVDPRQPRNNASIGTNPPVFTWSPMDDEWEFRLVVSDDPAFGNCVIDLGDLATPMFLPESALESGVYFWKWYQDEFESEVFSFTISKDCVRLEIPPSAQWSERICGEHPRMLIRPDEVDAIRESRHNERSAMWAALKQVADEALTQPVRLRQPKYTQDSGDNYYAWSASHAEITRQTRRFMATTQLLALAYLVSGETEYGEAAVDRLETICVWDPIGSTHITTNDEAHMAVIRHGSLIYDWVYDLFSDIGKKRVRDHLRKRGQITFEYMNKRSMYGIQRFDSHSSREVVYLGLLAIALHSEVPETGEWLEWLRPSLGGIWPIWGDDDGSWAEGHIDSLTDVGAMALFASALKTATNIDLFQRPFWKNHAEWCYACFPPNSEWIGFGDHSQPRSHTWQQNADHIEMIARQVGLPGYADHVARVREEATDPRHADSNELPYVNPIRYLSTLPAMDSEPTDRNNMLWAFSDTGWAAIRTSPDDLARDVGLIFRSSPYGSVSHSHANNNDFVIHVAGRTMVMPSGYYDGFASPHHINWIWHTKSHNCVTLSDASQLMRSYDSIGMVEHDFENEHLVYLRGNADASYSRQAAKCRRHVIYLKSHGCFVIVDEFEALSGIYSALQWNLHSWSEFQVDEANRQFVCERDGRKLTGHFLFHNHAYFTQNQGWDPEPVLPDDTKPTAQYNLRFTPSVGFPRRVNLGVVLCPEYGDMTASPLNIARDGDVEVCNFDNEDFVAINPGYSFEYRGISSNAVCLLYLAGETYEIV